MSVKLAPRSIFFLTLAACVLAAMGWYFLRFQPRQQEITLLRGDLELTRSRAETYRAAQRALPELRQTVAGLEVERDQFLRALPATAQFGTVLDEVRRNVTAAGAELTSFTVQSGNVAGLPGGVRPINLSLSVQGRFAEVFRALRSLETQNRFTTVGALGLQLPQADALDPRLQGTLNLTVYTFDQTQPGTAGAAPQAPEAAPAAPPAPQGGTQ
ncbi:type 4a pilus biogenesis protein PilO [Deinococcus planocerae]|uniref:type 4a pilus biogenesis protein PilO n=1 Tax=Deinococcus planocerae TaxID=1737569 RepID=UPI000C7F18C3|nr:type 4a pilus biogenesis protein PilO [Deinococcus planocerae]